MSGYDQLDHLVRYRKIQTIWKVYAPIATAVVALIVLFVCYGRQGVVGDYAAIIALFAGAVTFLSALAVVSMMMKEWNTRGQAFVPAQKEPDKS